MITVGCDVGKSDLVVFLDGKHYKFKNEKVGIEKFILQCKNREVSRIVLEPTGGITFSWISNISCESALRETFCRIR